MSFITFQCYACGQMLKVGADKAGRKAKCNKCGTALTIPVSSTVQEPEAVPAPRPAPPPLPATPVQPEPILAQVAPTPATPVEAVPPGRRPPFAELNESPPRRRDDDVEEDDYRPLKKVSRWPRVRLGLLLVFIGMCVLAGAFALEMLAYLLFSAETIRSMLSRHPHSADQPSMETAFKVLQRISVLLQLAAAPTAIVGYVFCILGPSKRGMMGLAIATTAVAGVSLVLLFVKMFIFPWYFGSEHAVFIGLDRSWFGTWFVWLLSQLAFAAELILFPFYLRAASLARKVRWNAQACTLVAGLGCVYAAERLIALVLLYVSTQSLFNITPGALKAWAWINLILLWIGAVVFTLQIILYIVRVWRTRVVIE
jgi:hypothetical protein